MHNNRIKADERCTGCNLCVYKCPVDCIHTVQDEEGFFIPEVDDKRCIDCGICKVSCPIEKENDFGHRVQGTYAVQLKEEEALSCAASGGAFLGFAKTVLDLGGMVAGVVDSIRQGADFLLTDRLQDVMRMCGSKYFQCNLSREMIEKINTELKNGRLILFAGVGCQTAALSGSVKEEQRKNLFLIDIICQGAPSQYAINSYREYISRKYKKKLACHDFRSKDQYHKGQYVSRLVFEDGEILYQKGERNLYSRAFQRKIYLREACYQCHFTNLHRPGDVTIGDFWGLDCPEIDHTKGVSLVLVHSEKGRDMLERAKHQFVMAERELDEAVKHNLPLTTSVGRPLGRTFSYHLMKRLGFAWATRLLCLKYYIKRLLPWR